MQRAFLLLATGACALATARAQAPLCVDESFQFGYPPVGEMYDVAFMANGRIIAAGLGFRQSSEVIQQGGSSTIGMARVLPNGAIDPTFGPAYVNAGSQITIQDGYLYYQNGGVGFRRNHIVDGTPDFTYRTPFRSMFVTGHVSSYHLFPDGTMWRLGAFTKEAWDEEGNLVLHQPGYGLVRALPNGHYDPDFDHKYTPGTFLRNFNELPDGNFLITASNGLEYEGHPVGALFKVKPNSHLDTTFQTTITWTGGGSTIYHYSDGRMLVFGRFIAPEYPNDTLAVMRLLPDGSTDTTWPSIPFLAYGYFRGLAAVWGYLEIEPGKLIVVGDFNEIGGQPLGAITTIDTAGNVLWDYLPGTGAGFTQPLYGVQPGRILSGIKKGPDGYIYIWGRFSGYNDGCGDHPEQRLLMRLYPLDVGVGEEAAVVPALSVYPNPADDRLHIAWDMPGKCSVLVEDMQGRTVLAHSFRKGDAPLDISMLSPGVYLLSVISETGTRAVTKWIQQ